MLNKVLVVIHVPSTLLSPIPLYWDCIAQQSHLFLLLLSTRHLNGAVLETLSRPSLLITDSFNALNVQARRRERDTQLMSKLYIQCAFRKNLNLKQCSKLAVVWLSEMTKKFTGQPFFGVIKSLVAQRAITYNPAKLITKLHLTSIMVRLLMMSNSIKLI